jgi:hypothetical protein
MYLYFIHFQRVKASAHTIPVRTTVATRAIMKTAVEDVVAAATMMVTVAAVAGTMTEDTAADVTTIAVVMVEDATMIAEAVTTTGGTKYRSSRGDVPTSFCLTLHAIPLSSPRF